MEITNYKNGKQSYDFKINRRQFAEFIGYTATVDNKCGVWWLMSTEGEQIKLVVEEDK